MSKKYINKYGVEFEVGDYVMLSLPFYNFSIWKVIEIKKVIEGEPYRLFCDQGRGHSRGFSIDNPFIKIDKKCGSELFENEEFEKYIRKAWRYEAVD